MKAASAPFPVYGPVDLPALLAQVVPCEIAIGAAASDLAVRVGDVDRFHKLSLTRVSKSLIPS